MDNYYDSRFLLLPLINQLKSVAHSAGEADSAGFIMNEVKLLLMFIALLSFLVTTIRFPNVLRCPRHFRRHVELRFGRSAFSLPFTLSLTATLFLPPSAFWDAYLFIIIMSFWSDAIHFLFTGISYAEEHFLLLPVAHVNTHPLSVFVNEQGAAETDTQTETDTESETETEIAP